MRCRFLRLYSLPNPFLTTPPSLFIVIDGFEFTCCLLARMPQSHFSIQGECDHPHLWNSLRKRVKSFLETMHVPSAATQPGRTDCPLGGGAVRSHSSGSSSAQDRSLDLENENDSVATIEACAGFHWEHR